MKLKQIYQYQQEMMEELSQMESVRCQSQSHSHAAIVILGTETFALIMAFVAVLAIDKVNLFDFNVQ